MKTNHTILAFLVLITFGMASCTKEPGFEGKAVIKGKVSYVLGTADKAVVSIKFDASAPTTEYDYRTVTDSSGNYRFEALSKGDYYLNAEYMDMHGMKFSSGGFHVKIGDSKGEVTVDFLLN